MGRGSSKAGGSSSSSAGGIKKSVSNVEQGFYDLKNASQKTVKQKMADAPQGTTIAYTTEGGNTIVYEKNRKSITGDIWMKTTMNNNGISTVVAKESDVVRSLVSMTKGNDKKGLTEEQRKRYNSKGKKLIKDYWS